jgi:hypothetical protein
MLGTSKSIWGFVPTSVPGCTLWLDGADNNSMNSTSAVTQWNDKSGNSNNVTGTGTWSGGTMVFNGTTNAFSNTAFVFPVSAYSMFAVYSNTTAPASLAYMNAVYGSNGYPMLGTYDTGKFVTARSVVANTGALSNVGWAARIASASTTSSDIGFGIATDLEGSVFVIGYYGPGVPTVYNQGASGTSNVTLLATGGDDIFIAKYSSAGAVLWASRISSTGSDRGFGVATDSLGNVLVIGQYAAALTVYNQGASGTSNVTLPFAGVYDCFVAKYLPDGSVSWAARISGTGTDIGQGIATDSSGNVLVTGYYDAAVTFYNQGASGTSNVTLPFAGVSDCFVAKYNSIGDVQWAARIAGTGTDIGQGIATDSSGNVLVTGYYDAAVTFYNQGASGTSNVTLPFAGVYDCFVAKYLPDGSVSWAARISGTGTDIGQGIATDSSGNVLVTGYYDAAVTFYNQGASGTSNVTLPFAGVSDCFVAKYNSIGDVQWAARIAGTGGDQGNRIATDMSGNVLVTGQYNAAVTIYNQGSNGTGAVTLPFTSGDSFVAKYLPDGSVSWAARISGSGTDISRGIASDQFGNVLVTGQYNAAVTLYNRDGSTGATLTHVGNNDVFIAKYDKDGFITKAPTPANSNVLVDATYASSAMSAFINGTSAPAIFGTTLAATGVFVGGPSNFFNGTISEVLIYNNTLTATQRQAVEGYLAYKWRIQSNLPTTQLYYSRPPFNRVFTPTDIATCSVWMDGGDNSTMNSTTTVTTWNDKSGNARHMTGSGTWSGSNMVFNGSTNAFSNTGYVFPISAYSLFAVYSNTTAPAAAAYMNVMYGANGFPMLGTYDVGKSVTARSVVANTGALSVTAGWAARGSAASSQGNGVATDLSKNVFIVGVWPGSSIFTLSNTDGTPGVTFAAGGGGAASIGFLAKYSSIGKVIWAARFGDGSGVMRAQAVATDSSGSVFVGGLHGTTFVLSNATNIGGTYGSLVATNDCVFIAKYSSSGTVLWAASILINAAAQIRGVATDSTGSVFITGLYGATATLSNATSIGGTYSSTLLLSAGASCNAFVAKYSSTGTVLWAAALTATAVIGWGIAVDLNGNAFVSGSYNSTMTLSNATTVGGTYSSTLTFTGVNTNNFLAKYSPTGTVIWAAAVTGSIGTSNQVAVDSTGNPFICGYYGSGATITLRNATTIGGTYTPALPAASGYDIFVVKFSSNGSVLWAAQIGGTGTDTGYAIATDPSGNVFVTGNYNTDALTVFNSTAIGGSYSPTLAYAGGSGNDAFVAKYSSTGTASWGVRVVGSTGFDSGFGIATDTDGNCFVTGYFAGTFTVGVTRGSGTSFSNPAGTYLVKYAPDGSFLAPVPANSNVLVDATYLPSTMSPFANGTAANTLAGTTLATTGLYLGGPSNYFNGSLSELIIYASTLTSGQRQAVEGYLAAKWGLRASLISTQPFKVIPPATSV